jgi:hypothetical protein
MNKRITIYTLIFYIIGIAAIVIGNLIDPTNLAGPGLDALAFIIVALSSIILIVRAIMKLVKNDRSYLVPLGIHLGVWVLFIGYVVFGIVFEHQ